MTVDRQADCREATANEQAHPARTGARRAATDNFQLVVWPGTPGQAKPVQGRIPVSITIETEDCRKTFEELKSRSVEFETDVLEQPWGYVALFQDPDGNRLQIRQGR